MNETTDPVLDALCATARVQDADLDSPEVRVAITRITPSPRQRHPVRMTLVAAAVVAVTGIGGWWTVAPTDAISANPADTSDLELVAARFDAAAARFPLPKGQDYDALRAQVLVNEKSDQEPGAGFIVGNGRMPMEDVKDRSTAIAALVARYSGCKWWEIEANGKFDELNSREQVEIQKRNQEALTKVLKVTKNPDRIPLTDLWDELCKDVE